VPRSEHTDVVVVGSGFGGSTAALRLTEKGYRVTVLEAGRRFADDELPKTSWDLRRYLWAPKLNLGVNPSLTITAQAERATALWPNKGQLDARPAPGQAYRRVAPVPPARPVVPAHAPAALRLLPLTVVQRTTAG